MIHQASAHWRYIRSGDLLQTISERNKGVAAVGEFDVTWNFHGFTGGIYGHATENSMIQGAVIDLLLFIILQISQSQRSPHFIYKMHLS